VGSSLGSYEKNLKLDEIIPNSLYEHITLLSKGIPVLVALGLLRGCSGALPSLGSLGELPEPKAVYTTDKYYFSIKQWWAAI